MKLARTMQINTSVLSTVPAIETMPRPSRLPLSFPQQRLWSLLRLEGGSESRHIQIGLRLHGELDEAALQSALDGLAARHEVLRTNFEKGGRSAVPEDRAKLARRLADRTCGGTRRQLSCCLRSIKSERMKWQRGKHPRSSSCE